jgi:hypothetical protein
LFSTTLLSFFPSPELALLQPVETSKAKARKLDIPIDNDFFISVNILEKRSHANICCTQILIV